MTSVLFTGDIGFDHYMTGRFEDDGLFSGDILRICAESDHVVANVEGALTVSGDVNGKGRFFHAMDPRAVRALNALHADVWNLANNHSMDGGEPGLRDALRFAQENGTVTVGAGLNNKLAAKPVLFPEEGGIGILACGYHTCIPATEQSAGCLDWNDDALLSETIREIKKTCRFCVLIVHGGEEFCALPLPYMRDRYHHYLDLGADAVVAHHPHVPQNYERCEGGKWIFYSLGNFVFDTDYQRAHAYTDTGILLRLRFGESGIDFEAFGTKLIRGEERVTLGELPAIFTHIGEDDFNALTPLGARAFLEERKRKDRFMHPDLYGDFTEEAWLARFLDEKSIVQKNEHDDIPLVVRLSEKCGNDDAIPAVRDYLKALL